MMSCYSHRARIALDPLLTLYTYCNTSGEYTCSYSSSQFVASKNCNFVFSVLARFGRFIKPSLQIRALIGKKRSHSLFFFIYFFCPKYRPSSQQVKIGVLGLCPSVPGCLVIGWLLDVFDVFFHGILV